MNNICVLYKYMPGPGSSTQIDNSLHSKESSHEPEETEIYYYSYEKGKDKIFADFKDSIDRKNLNDENKLLVGKSTESEILKLSKNRKKLIELENAYLTNALEYANNFDKYFKDHYDDLKAKWIASKSSSYTSFIDRESQLKTMHDKASDFKNELKPTGNDNFDTRKNKIEERYGKIKEEIKERRDNCPKKAQTETKYTFRNRNDVKQNALTKCYAESAKDLANMNAKYEEEIKNLKDTSHIGGNVEQSSGDNLTQPPNTKTKLSEEEQKVYDHWYTDWRNTQYMPYKKQIAKETRLSKVSKSQSIIKAHDEAIKALEADYTTKITREKYDEYFHNKKQPLTDAYNDYIKKKEADTNRVKIENDQKKQLVVDRDICMKKADEIKKKIFQDKARMKAKKICGDTYNTKYKEIGAQKAGNYSIKYSNNKMNYLKL
jgi:hypothetical protein